MCVCFCVCVCVEGWGALLKDFCVVSERRRRRMREREYEIRVAIISRSDREHQYSIFVDFLDLMTGRGPVLIHRQELP